MKKVTLQLLPISEGPQLNGLQVIFIDGTGKHPPAQGFWLDGPMAIEPGEYDCFVPAPWASCFILLSDLQRESRE